MDGLEDLMNEMKRKRKAIESFEIKDGSTKYIRRGDIVAQKEQEYLENQKKKYAEQKPETSALQTLTSRDHSEHEKIAVGDDITEKLPFTEVISRLRRRNQPILLFGESVKEVRARLLQLEIEQPDLNEGWSNDLVAARKAVDNDLMKEVIEGPKPEKKNLNSDVLLPTFEEDWEKIHRDAEDLGKGDDMPRDCRVISSFFKYILSRWGDALNNRNDELKKSNHGRQDATDHQLALDHMRPLIKLLDKEKINNDIRHHLANICRLLIIDRDYIQASNAYMEMAIGNAPWPVGVTRSGIHQRPGSAKAYVSNIAHVLNDETQRKYIQSVKRIITRCQEYFPTDPSKCVEYVRPNE
ncbi:unnamed protein product, partial [Mesorhabditis belari]|uniref:Pre-mRNA-splicing factor 18 n=1 Tax=Mesorhabditis belari TaxID=2138241 RepID=A0AAF3J3H5_9BILA